MGIPVEYSPSRERPLAARDRPALRRCAVHGRRGDDLQAGGEGDRAEARRARLVHAQAHGGRSRAAACTCTRACSTSTATTRSSTRDDPQGYNLSKVAKHYIAGLLKYAPEFCAGHEPVRELLQAPGLRGRGPHVPVVGRSRNRSTLVRIPGYRPDREDARAASSCAAPTPPRTPTWPSPPCWRRGSRASRTGWSCSPPPRTRTCSALSRQDLRRQGIADASREPGRGRGAVRRRPTLMRETLGDHIHAYLVDAKRAEWNELPGQRERSGSATATWRCCSRGHGGRSEMLVWGNQSYS